MPDGAIEHGSRRARPGVTAVWAKPRAKLLLVGNSAEFDQLVPHAIAGELLPPNSSIYAAGLGVCLWLRPDQRMPPPHGQEYMPLRASQTLLVQ